MSLFLELTLPSGTKRLSTHKINSGTYKWDNKIVRMSPFALNYRDGGGYIKPSMADIVFAPDTFSGTGDWPSPDAISSLHKWNADEDDSSLTSIFKGEAVSDEDSNDENSYRFFEPDFGVDILANGVDENNNTIVVPKVFGTHEHLFPQRTYDASAGYKYYKSGIDGTKGVDWHCFDDGVNIDSNVTETNTDGTGTFSLSSTPVGQVTFSGTSAYATDLNELFTWACGSSFLNLTLDHTYDESPSPSIAFYQTTQTRLIDILDEAAGFRNHIFRIDPSDTLHLIHRNVDVATSTLNGGRDTFKVKIKKVKPIKHIKAEWVTNAASSTNKNIYEVPQNYAALGSFEQGEEISIKPYHVDYDEVQGALDALMVSWSRRLVEITMPIPATFPVFGEKITLTDDTYYQTITGWFRVLSMVFDWLNYELKITAAGELT